MSGDHEVNAVFFTDACTPVENRIGEEGAGWSIAKFLLENERGGSCFAPRLIQSIDRLEELAQTQPSGVNGAIAHDPRFRDRLARVRLEAEALEVTELRILAELAKGRAPGPQTSLVKLLGSNIRPAGRCFSGWNCWDRMRCNCRSNARFYGNEAPEPVGSEYAQTADGPLLEQPRGDDLRRVGRGAEEHHRQDRAGAVRGHD